jgi:hypothetical protein
VTAPIEITDDVVETATRAQWEKSRDAAGYFHDEDGTWQQVPAWEDAPEDDRAFARSSVRAALEAAAPAMRKQVLAAAYDEIDRYAVTVGDALSIIERHKRADR